MVRPPSVTLEIFVTFELLHGAPGVRQVRPLLGDPKLG
jgi:hypothetical protein